MSQLPIFEGVMKYVGVVEYPQQLDEIVHEAFRQALSGVPGPTYVELPLGLMQATFDLPPAPDRYRLTSQRADDRRIVAAAESFGAHGEYVERVEDIGPAIERALSSGKPAVIHVEVDQGANSTFAGIPGFLEFRNWYGEEGDFLGVPGGSSSAPVPAGRRIHGEQQRLLI